MSIVHVVSISVVHMYICMYNVRGRSVRDYMWSCVQIRKNGSAWICITALDSFMVKVLVLCCGLQLNVVYVVMHKVHILALSLTIGCIRGLINSVD